MRTTALAMVFALLALHAAPARGGEAPRPPGGTLDAVASDGTPLGGCPLEHTDVHAEIAGFVARVTVTQRFANPFRDPIEAVYTFPLSERAAVDAMTMRTGTREIRGEIRTRAEAHRLYEQAKRAGRLASVLDQERPNVFTQSLANVLPGAAVEITLSYVEPLRFAAGTFELVVPTVVGPRFVPPSGVPDATRVTPPVTPEGVRAGHDLAVGVDVDAGVPILDVSSPLHAIDVERPDPRRARVRLRDGREVPNRDFVLRYAVATDAVQSGWLAHRDPGADGYATFVLLPPRRVPADAAAPRELVFVIDRSGSQAGAPLEKAKETLRWALEHMNPDDTFQVVDFGSTANVLFPKPERASVEMKRRARAYVDALEANGGTMMADAIEAVCRMPADAHRLRIVTFMTDGYVGNDLEVLGLVRRLRGTSRWFPFGTGNGVNRFLIDGMARLGGGEAAYVLSSEPGDAAARTFWSAIAAPVLTDVHVDFDGLDVVDVYPRDVSDVWAERPLVIHARYRRAGRGRVVLRGFRQGRPYEQALDVTLPDVEPAHEAIASMWARSKVEALTNEDLGALQTGNFPAPLERQIVEVALAHRLLTPFTSFVAVEDRVVNEGGASRTVTVPVEMPDGVSYEGVFGRRDAGDAAAPANLAATPRAKAAGTLAPSGVAQESLDAGSRVERKAAVPLRAAQRARLAPDLVVLLEQGPGARGAAPSAGGWARVRVVAAAGAADAVRTRLEALGAYVETTADPGMLVATIGLDRLAAAADVEGVGRIEPV